jgi:hypothetical protein
MSAMFEGQSQASWQLQMDLIKLPRNLYSQESIESRSRRSSHAAFEQQLYFVTLD